MRYIRYWTISFVRVVLCYFLNDLKSARIFISVYLPVTYHACSLTGMQIYSYLLNYYKFLY